jgi:hypothetical protein
MGGRLPVRIASRMPALSWAVGEYRVPPTPTLATKRQQLQPPRFAMDAISFVGFVRRITNTDNDDCEKYGSALIDRSRAATVVSRPHNVGAAGPRKGGWGMRIRTLTTTTMVVAVTVAGISAHARAEVIEKATFKGNFAFAFFSQETPITCADGSAGTLTITVSVSGNEFVSRSRQFPDTATNTLSASASRSDSCAGTAVFGTAEVANASSQNGLQSATLVATVTLTDFEGTPVGTLAVNLTLEGTGFTSRNQSHNRFEFEGPDGPIVVISRSKGTFRNATASGSVVFDGVELIDALLFSSLQQSSSGSSQLQR